MNAARFGEAVRCLWARGDYRARVRLVRVLGLLTALDGCGIDRLEVRLLLRGNSREVDRVLAEVEDLAAILMEPSSDLPREH